MECTRVVLYWQVNNLHEKFDEVSKSTPFKKMYCAAFGEFLFMCLMMFNSLVSGAKFDEIYG